nr:putative PEP-binding protein [Ketogulonicigenium robustum]
MRPDVFGGRAKCLQRLIRLQMPVPTTVALSFDAVRGIARGQMPDIGALMAPFGAAPLLSVRPSSLDPDWGGPGAILNIGLCDASHASLSASLGADVATKLYLQFIQIYATQVARLNPDAFHFDVRGGISAVRSALSAYEAEMDEPFPQDPAEQLSEVLRSMARTWEGTSARLLRQAKGAPSDAGLGLVVQTMAFGVGPGESGAGVIQFADSNTGAPRITGRYLSQSQGREALAAATGAIYLTHDTRGSSLEDENPAVFARLKAFGQIARTRLREEMQIEFTLSDGVLHIIDAVRVPRTVRAAVRIAVDLAESGIIPRDEAVHRIDVQAISAMLHRQVNPDAARDLILRAIGASPGAAHGKVVLTAEDAQAAAARGEAAILVRRETTPEDIRGMHAAAGVLTQRGGVTSHAAVVGRGLGVPCVVGASGLVIDRRGGRVIAPDGRVILAGDTITVDGFNGEVLAGEAPLREAQLDDAFQTLLAWADASRDIGIRANADTPRDARIASTFAAEGIGLCRTEHMFFEGDRIGMMREMIFAANSQERREVLGRLLPTQRQDFIRLFEIMNGKPVCIRLFDPPLHEFLPSDRAGMRDLADGLSLPLADVMARVEAMSEYNPMLGLRGVRLGITVPEIYEMQARAIFEATVAVSRDGLSVTPEIMIPLVSARREVQLVRGQIDAVASAVRAQSGVEFTYRLGVMVETPRAALRAGDIAQDVAFLSFGTNDLTQMTYGLSRDDAGRFMPAYLANQVFPDDPFHTLDLEGVGELLQIGAARARGSHQGVTLSVCGEHGGSAQTIAFCRKQGFDYVSCSPFRVPLARLAAAQIAIRERSSFPTASGKYL